MDENVRWLEVHGGYTLGRRILSNMPEPAGDITFVVVDVETTGMNPWRDRVTEIAMVKVQDGEVRDEFSTLINPQQFIPPYITSFTGITNEMVFTAPKASEVMPKFLQFLGEAVLVGHNVSFDVGFLNATLQRTGHSTLLNKTVCTCRLARRLLPHLRSKSLEHVTEHLGIDVQQRHRALADAHATARVLLHFLSRLSEDGEIEEFTDLLSLQYKSISQFRKLPRNVRNLKDAIRSLPEEPGVYFLRDKHGAVIYIGKAKNLKDRVNSYFYYNTSLSRKVQELVRSVHSITYQTTGSELSALLLESQSIKKYRPQFNSLIKRYRRYPFIKIDVQSELPRVSWSYDLEADGAEYFGPFRNRDSVESAIEIINRLFLLRECDDELDLDQNISPCFYYQIKRCGAPCAGLQSVNEYREEVDRVRRFITGEHQEAIGQIEQRMQLWADTLRFEEAAELRDRIQDLKRILAQQQIIMKAINDHNLIIMIPAKRTTVELFFVRFGRLRYQTLVDQYSYDPEELRHRLEMIYGNEQEQLGACRKEELDEMRIISSWITRNDDHRSLIFVEPGNAVEDILRHVRSTMASYSQRAKAVHSDSDRGR